MFEGAFASNSSHSQPGFTLDSLLGYGQGQGHKVTLGTRVDGHGKVKVDISQLSTYIIGMPSMGKSNLLAKLFLENADHSKILIDPQGKLTYESILPNLTDISRIFYYAPYEQRENPWGFNPFDIGRESTEFERDLLVGQLRQIFVHLWLSKEDRSYVNMEMVIQNALRLLVEFEGMTFLDFERILLDKSYREKLLEKVSDEQLKYFWRRHYRPEMGGSTYNKINEFVGIRAVRNTVCQPRSSFYLDQLIAQGKTIIVRITYSSALRSFSSAFISTSPAPSSKSRLSTSITIAGLPPSSSPFPFS